MAHREPSSIIREHAAVTHGGWSRRRSPTRSGQLRRGTHDKRVAARPQVARQAESALAYDVALDVRHAAADVQRERPYAVPHPTGAVRLEAEDVLARARRAQAIVTQQDRAPAAREAAEAL